MASPFPGTAEDRCILCFIGHGVIYVCARLNVLRVWLYFTNKKFELEKVVVRHG